MKDKISGIYKITNLINNKVYIGESSDIHSRWNTHKRAKGKKSLYKDIRKYGLDNFKFEVILEVVNNKSLRLQLENTYKELYQSYDTDKGYNVRGLEGNKKR